MSLASQGPSQVNNSFQSLTSSGALGATLQASSAVPIVGAVVGIATSILGAVFAAHAKKVKEEASTLDGAVPSWRQLIQQVADAYSSGAETPQACLAYIEQARNLYYTQVKAIQHGTVPAGGCGTTEYYNVHGRFAPINPCNGACFIGYYYIEPEATLCKQAIASGKNTTVEIVAFNVRNGDSETGGVLDFNPPLVSELLPASIEAALPKVVQKNFLLFAGLGVLIVGGLVFGTRR